MTAERAEFHRLMLLAGIQDLYDAEMDRALVEEEPLSDLVLGLAFCLSDRGETVHLLREYRLDHSCEDEAVFSMIVEEARRRYGQGRLSVEGTIDLLYRIWQVCEEQWEDPWDRLREPSDEYDYVDMGIADRREFVRQFENWLFHSGRVHFGPL